MSHHDREVIEKLRKISRNAANQGVDIPQIFRRFTNKGSDKMTQDELLIAMSRVCDNVSLGDVKELHRIIIGSQTSTGIEDVKIPVNEVVQMLTL